jgi:hypothetical protein
VRFLCFRMVNPVSLDEDVLANGIEIQLASKNLHNLIRTHALSVCRLDEVLEETPACLHLDVLESATPAEWA